MFTFDSCLSGLSSAKEHIRIRKRWEDFVPDSQLHCVTSNWLLWENGHFKALKGSICMWHFKASLQVIPKPRSPLQTKICCSGKSSRWWALKRLCRLPCSYKSDLNWRRALKAHPITMASAYGSPTILLTYLTRQELKCARTDQAWLCPPEEKPTPEV